MWAFVWKDETFEAAEKLSFIKFISALCHWLIFMTQPTSTHESGSGLQTAGMDSNYTKSRRFHWLVEMQQEHTVTPLWVPNRSWGLEVGMAALRSDCDAAAAADCGYSGRCLWFHQVHCSAFQKCPRGCSSLRSRDYAPTQVAQSRLSQAGKSDTGTV